MGVNFVQFGNQTVMDIRDTTATASDVASGKYFYTAAGVKTQGTASGGGASNVVMGNFTTSSSGGSVMSVDIPYTGNGYPIALTIYVTGGSYVSDSEWYTTINRYAIGMWSMTKSNISAVPTYATTGANNQGVVAVIYKNSTSSATSYTRTSAMNANTFSASNANTTATTAVRFRSDTRISLYVKSSSYGFLPDTSYSYIAVYSE